MMKRLAMFMAGLAFCIHGTTARPPSTSDDAGRTRINAAAAQQWSPTYHAPPGTTIAQRAYVDPATGELVNPPEHEAPVASDSIQPSALSTSAETMEEKPSPMPGGGVMIDLKGRLKSPVRATIEGNGETTIRHPASGRME